MSDLESARHAATHLLNSSPDLIIAATSIPTVECNLANLLIGGGQSEDMSVLRLPAAPHGTGDLFAALLLGHHLNGLAVTDAFRKAVDGVDAVLAASSGKEELELSASQNLWVSATNSAPEPS